MLASTRDSPFCISMPTACIRLLAAVMMYKHGGLAVSMQSSSSPPQNQAEARSDLLSLGNAPIPKAPDGGPVRGMCVKDTGKTCKSQDSISVVEQYSQCAAGGHDPFMGMRGAKKEIKSATFCSVDYAGGPSGTTGTCQCAAGFCGDVDRRCHSGTYRTLSDVFTISIKLGGANEVLFMAPDGTVKLGTPRNPRAAKWRISVTHGGAKMLWSELYYNTVLQEYEKCVDQVDSYGTSVTKCSLVVGHVPDARADEMGWYIENFADKLHSQAFGGLKYVQIRSAKTWSMFYVSPVNKEGRACDEKSRNCPGGNGAFKFDPPLHDRVDFVLDSAHRSPALISYCVTVAVAILMLCCLGCIYTPSGRKLLCIPVYECLRALGIGQGAKI